MQRRTRHRFTDHVHHPHPEPTPTQAAEWTTGPCTVTRLPSSTQRQPLPRQSAQSTCPVNPVSDHHVGAATPPDRRLPTGTTIGGRRPRSRRLYRLAARFSQHRRRPRRTLPRHHRRTAVTTLVPALSAHRPTPTPSATRPRRSSGRRSGCTNATRRSSRFCPSIPLAVRCHPALLDTLSTDGHALFSAMRCSAGLCSAAKFRLIRRERGRASPVHPRSSARFRRGRRR